MRKKKNLKGFTLTELAIVIAVIAILIAVLVPTFISLINNANESADEQAVKNMNTVLQADEVSNGTPEKIEDAMQVLTDAGLNVENYQALDSNNTIYYDYSYNRCLLWSASDNAVIYPSDLASTYSGVSGRAGSWYTLSEAYVTKTVDSDGKIELSDGSTTTVANAVSSAGEGESLIIKLPNTISVLEVSSSMSNSAGAYITIDLNGKKMDYTVQEETKVSGGSTLYIKNGSFVDNGILDNNNKVNGSYGVFVAEDNSSITLENVDIISKGSILYPAGDAAQVNVIDSTLYTAGSFCIATNGSTAYSCTILIENSTLQCQGTIALCINVDVDVAINNSTIIAGVQDASTDNTGSQTILLRAGTINMTNSTVLYYRHGASDSGAIYWGSGNDAPRAAIVIGDASNNYTSANAELNMTNCTVSVVDNTTGNVLTELRAIYMYGKDTQGYKSTLNFESTTINGQLIVGGSQDVTNTSKPAQYECEVVHINGTSYYPETVNADSNDKTTKGVAYTQEQL